MDKKNPNLSSVQKLVMFEDGTEPPGSSELNNEKRKGSYHCANCGLKLFDSQSNYLDVKLLKAVFQRHHHHKLYNQNIYCS